MKKTIFIDANIFLRFYDSNSEEFKKLLKSLEEIKGSVFVTKQIHCEIERNKLDVFMRSFIGYDKQFGITNTTLPEHLESKTDNEIKNWNKATDDLIKKIKEQKKKLKKLTENLLTSISENKDEVSLAFQKAFSNIREANSKQIERAKQRKEFGNPPGKNNDPLGDQITWEQLLDNAKSIDELWIITNDNDYFFEFSKKCYLNSFLTHELRQKNKSIKIHCFNTLSEGFSSFNKSHKISTLPNDKELTKITIEEKKSNKLYDYLYGTSGNVNLIGLSGPTSSNAFTGVSGFGNPLGSFSSNYHFPLINCDECGKIDETNSLYTYSNIHLLSSFHTCPSCNRHLCSDCWPHSNLINAGSGAIVAFQPVNTDICPTCSGNLK